jgi:phenylalanyl-tRNA synthetase alpha chain
MDENRNEALAEIAAAACETAVRDVEVRWLGKKGRVTSLLKEIGALPAEERKARGAALNALRRELEEAIASRRDAIESAEIEALATRERTDVTLPGLPVAAGHLHPLTRVMDEAVDVFERLGYHVMDYPEAESEFYNFDGPNIPADHPARDMQDTFYLEDPPGGPGPGGATLLRTHTTPGQIRAMRELTPPFWAILPGRVYRCEATDASHEHTFHQIEGLAIDRHVSVAHMLHSIRTLLEGIFRRPIECRLRPGYFPFVEPGFELDLRCMICGGPGCPACKHSGWVELLGCGLVHPNVIRAGGLDPAEWQGWAFGVGLSRLVMNRYQIDDIRWLMSGDLRFTRQF